MTASVLAAPVLGKTEPRLFTPPLRELTPETSYGFEVIDFAREIDHPLLPWQEFAVIHGGELLPDGRPRFRIVVLLVSRQNGKTELPVVLSVYWQFRKSVPLILGTSTQLSYAKESWQKAVSLVRRTRLLDDLHEPGRKWLRRTNGETESWTLDGARYRIAASNSEGGRSLTIHRGIADELRQHRTYEAWDAFEPACSPEDAQIWCLSNAGDARSVVLNDLQDSAREFIETGVGDPRLGLLEWSAPEDADPEDVDALLQANPRVGYGLDLEVLKTGAARAKRLGGEALAGFKTERMCIRVKLMNPAIDPGAWSRCAGPVDLAGVRSRVALCVDVAPDQQHASLYAAAVLADGRVAVDHVGDWSGATCTHQLRRELPALIAKVRPQALGYLPSGPGASLVADLADRRKAGRTGWPPAGVKVEEIRGELTAVAMGFAELVLSGQIVHPDDPLLNQHVAGAEPLKRGDAWVFSRKGDGHVDALYAAAGAAHLARTLPTPVGKPRIVTAP
ncbi:terminase [Micromonospora sp. NPDC050686]|uniref:terminase n=1 Tax=Micromonospora sp. NPDC050686 TaxID=3154631 RepID=UPI0033C14F50